MRSIALLTLTVTLSLMATTAHAAIFSADDYQTIRINYQGIITSSPIDNIQIRQPDGSTVPYQGPVPDYPFKAGDPIMISFDAVLPSPKAIERGLVPASSNGIYQFQLGPGITADNSGIFGGGNLAAFGNFSGSGGIGQATDGSGAAVNSTDGGFAIVYNANDNSYSINDNFYNRPDGSDTFGLGFLNMITLEYDRDSGLVSSYRVGDANNSILAWSGLGGGQGRIPSVTYTGIGDSLLATNNLLFDGAFNLPFYAPPSQVPAPPALLLFGLAAGALTWRRRKAVATA